MKKFVLSLYLLLTIHFLGFGQTEFTVEQNVRYLSSSQLQGRNAGTRGDSLTQLYLIQVLKQWEINPLSEDYMQPFTVKMKASRGGDYISSKNIVACIEGSDSVLKKEYIIICAHFDHVGVEKGRIHPGANDNASGVAAVLSLANKFLRNPTKRSILIIFFGAEEKGLLGSHYFVKNPLIPLHSIVGVFNFDMVGKYKQEGFLYTKGEQTAAAFSPLIDQYAAMHQLNVEKSPYRYMDGSDHYPFYKKKIPVLFFNTGMDWDNYHKPSDLPEKIDFEGIESIAQFSFDLISAIANKPEKIKFKKK